MTYLDEAREHATEAQAAWDRGDWDAAARAWTLAADTFERHYWETYRERVTTHELRRAASAAIKRRDSEAAAAADAIAYYRNVAQDFDKDALRQIADHAERHAFLEPGDDPAAQDAKRTLADLAAAIDAVLTLADESDEAPASIITAHDDDSATPSAYWTGGSPEAWDERRQNAATVTADDAERIAEQWNDYARTKGLPTIYRTQPASEPQPSHDCGSLWTE